MLDKASTAPCLEDAGSQKLCGSFISAGGGDLGVLIILLFCFIYRLRYGSLSYLSVGITFCPHVLSALIAASSVLLMRYPPLICVFN